MPGRPAIERSRHSLSLSDGDVRGRGAPAESPIARWEMVTAPLLFALTIVLHVFYAFRWKFDSDEWQHLHVAWAWSQGLLEYRDIFDNHAPLFHMMTAPFVAAFGETPDILFLMRLVMLPLALATLAASAAIGRAVWGRRAALWTPVVLAPVPVFFFRSIEYRADGLWAALATGAIALMVTGPAGPARAFAAGLLLGLALVTSLKSLLLLFALTVAVFALPFAIGGVRRGAPLRHRLQLLSPLIGGLVLAPLALLLYYARRGAAQALIADTIRHNILPGLGTWAAPWRRLLFLPEIAVILGLAAWLARRHSTPSRAPRVAFLALTAGAFLAALQTLWPLYTTYDLLVFYPLLLPLVVGSMLASWDEPATTGSNAACSRSASRRTSSPHGPAWPPPESRCFPPGPAVF